MNESTLYLGKKYSVQWWVGALLRLRRTAREANYFTLRWESNLEFEFSKHFGLEGTSASAKKLVRTLQIVQLIEATPEEREKRCRESKDAARRWKEVQNWNIKFSESWDYYYCEALLHLRNELAIARDDREPEESSVRELAVRIKAWSNLNVDKKCHTNAFGKLLFNPGQRADPLEQKLQTEIRALRKHYAPSVWSRLTSRYRAKAHDS
jgi:hypothetical protein